MKVKTDFIAFWSKIGKIDLKESNFVQSFPIESFSIIENSLNSNLLQLNQSKM